MFTLKGGTVVVTDFLGREQSRLLHPGKRSELTNVAISPDGTRLATIRKSDKSLRIWDAVTGTEAMRFHNEAKAYTVMFNPAGNRIATVGGGRAQLWDAHTASFSCTSEASCKTRRSARMAGGWPS